MTQPSLSIVVLIMASLVSWLPGNRLLWCVWKLIARREGVKEGRNARLVKSIGGLERILYIMGVMGHHYELITGWLVLKAFFNFLERQKGTSVTNDKEQLERYNGMLIGNALSLLIGVGLGILSNLFIRWHSGAEVTWSL